LLPETAEILTTELDAIASGANLGEFDPYCLSWVDKDTSILYVPSSAGLLTFSYPWQCPPSGLATIDAILRDVVSTMGDARKPTRTAATTSGHSRSMANTLRS
jgi:hypothetical protein